MNCPSNQRRRQVKFIKIVTGEDQQSHFQEMEIELFEAEYGKLSNSIAVKKLIFGEIEGTEMIDWHNPPCRQFIIMLHGSMEIEIGDGTKKIFHEGDVVLAEDTTGQGHITHAASAGTRRYLAIPC